MLKSVHLVTFDELTPSRCSLSAGVQGTAHMAYSNNVRFLYIFTPVLYVLVPPREYAHCHHSPLQTTPHVFISTCLMNIGTSYEVYHSHLQDD